MFLTGPGPGLNLRPGTTLHMTDLYLSLCFQELCAPQSATDLTLRSISSEVLPSANQERCIPRWRCPLTLLFAPSSLSPDLQRTRRLNSVYKPMVPASQWKWHFKSKWKVCTCNIYLNPLFTFQFLTQGIFRFHRRFTTAPSVGALPGSPNQV